MTPHDARRFFPVHHKTPKYTTFQVLAFQFMHKAALCELGTIGVKIRNQLRFENPKTHKPDTANKVRASASLFGVKKWS